MFKEKHKRVKKKSHGETSFPAYISITHEDQVIRKSTFYHLLKTSIYIFIAPNKKKNSSLEPDLNYYLLNTFLISWTHFEEIMHET